MESSADVNSTLKPQALDLHAPMAQRHAHTTIHSFKVNNYEILEAGEATLIGFHGTLVTSVRPVASTTKEPIVMTHNTTKYVHRFRKCSQK